MKKTFLVAFLLALVPLVVRAEPPLPKPRVVTVAPTATRDGYALRLPWAYEPSHPTPLVIVLPARGQKASDAVKADGWEAVADRWGIALVAPFAAHKDAVTFALAGVGQHLKVDPARVYLYAGEQASLPAALTGITATFHRTGRQRAPEAWEYFERHTTHAPPDAPRSHRITLVVIGLSSSAGQIAASLWNRKDGFGEDDKNAVASGVAPITGGQATLTFTVREPGEYAVLILHDRNGNGKMDTSFGFPLEGFGASGNPRVGFGAPGWDECRFTVAPSDRDRRIVIKAVYL